MTRRTEATANELSELKQLRDYSDSLPTRHAGGRAPEAIAGNPKNGVLCQNLRNELASSLDSAESHALFPSAKDKIDIDAFRKAKEASAAYQHKAQAGVCAPPSLK